MAVEEESRGKGPEVRVPKVRSETDWSENEICIQCDEGGELLVCSDNTCPLAVHRECIRCSPHFDSTGNFFCPYCVCKQVMLAKRKAKKKAILAKKALSAFLDKRMVDGEIGDPLREKTEQNLLVNKGVNKDGRSEERLDSEHRTSVVRVPCNVSTSSAINGQNDVIGRCDQSEKSDLGRNSQREIQKLLMISQREEEIASRLEFVLTSVSDQEKSPKAPDDFQNERPVSHPKEMSVIEKRRNLVIERKTSIEGTLNDAEIEEENPKTVDNFQNKRVFQHHQEEGVISKRRKLGVEREKSAQRTLDKEPLEEEDNPEPVNEFRNKTADQHDPEVAVREKEKLGVEQEKSVEEQSDNEEIEEEMQEPEKKANVPAGGEVYMEQDDEVASDSSDGSREVVLQSSRCTKKRDQNVKVTKGECSRQPANKVQREKSNTRSRPGQSIPRAGFPTFKRNRRPWTTEEEEMLTEGVGKFASTGVKNIPWKKILSFGRHIFHGTRTPENLKDKWRGMTGQRDN